MITVEMALSQLFELVTPLESEVVSIDQAYGRILSEPVSAQRDQPPFAASAMDGYAVSDQALPKGLVLDVIGEAVAGKGFNRPVHNGKAVRIFTGAPLPQNASKVIIQENVEQIGDTIRISSPENVATFIRAAGSDFKAGDSIKAPRFLNSSDIALLAAMNVSKLQVRRKPVVALVSTGNELVMPGQNPTKDQIIASNTYGLAALLQNHGATANILPIARDNILSIQTALKFAEGADLIVTIGGASVGDYDLVADAAIDIGLKQKFYKVAMRPGKPLMAGCIGGSALIGLPGNPVSAMVCGHIFLIPVLNALLGLKKQQRQRKTAILMSNLDANGPREHYMRASVCSDGISIAQQQDSALLSILAKSNALAIRPPFAPAMSKGSEIEYISI